MNLRTVTEFVRLMATVAVAVRAGILLHRTIREEAAEVLQEETDPAPDAPTVYPPGSVGEAIQTMARNLADQAAKMREAGTAPYPFMARVRTDDPEGH